MKNRYSNNCGALLENKSSNFLQIPYYGAPAKCLGYDSGTLISTLLLTYCQYVRWLSHTMIRRLKVDYSTAMMSWLPN